MKYLSTELHSWPFSDSCRERGDFDDIARAYQIWEHAQELVNKNDSKLYLSDCIANLKRAINHRLQAIESIYSISKLPLKISSKKTLDRFEYLGLIRPAILNELINVRNVIEHQDKEPPEKKKCLFYIDIVWYFLKSTDPLVDDIVKQVEFDDHEKNNIKMDISTNYPWVFNITYKLEAKQLNEVFTGSEIELENVNDFGVSSGILQGKATLKPTDEQLVKLVHEYFSAANYWHENRADYQESA